MQNNLSPILLVLQEAFSSQPQISKKWADGVQVIEQSDEDTGTSIWWVRHQDDDEGTLLSEEQIQTLVEHGLAENEGVPTKKKFGRVQFAVGIRIAKLKREVRELESVASSTQVLTRKVKDLERQLKAARDYSAADAAMATLIESIRESYKLSTEPQPVHFNRTKPSKTQALAGVPTLALSDWHWGERVDPAQIEYLNEFNLDIANERADRVFKTSLELLFHHQAGQSYDGFVLQLAGDMFSGNIHEELRITNDAPIHDCLLSLAEKLAGGIMEFADNFEWVYIPAVVGNHGRIDRKPTAKNMVKDNYDWLLYNVVKMLVQGRMGSKCNVEFEISTAADINYAVYNTRYLLTHGDQIGGGSGVGGFWPSMMKTAHRKQQRSVKSGARGFDYMVCGHFHKYGSVSNVIVNGSLKGYDEWVYKMNFDYERPIQALWVTHPEHGIVSHTPVYADEYTSDALREAPPITRGDALLRRVR